MRACIGKGVSGRFLIMRGWNPQKLLLLLLLLCQS